MRSKIILVPVQNALARWLHGWKAVCARIMRDSSLFALLLNTHLEDMMKHDVRSIQLTQIDNKKVHYLPKPQPVRCLQLQALASLTTNLFEQPEALLKEAAMGYEPGVAAGLITYLKGRRVAHYGLFGCVVTPRCKV